jgi:sugar/nucleoside kinase (ribokinase family)
VGEDAAGDWQLAQLAAAGVDTAGLARVPGASTRSILLVDPEGERTIVNLGRAQEPEPPRRLLGMDADLIYVRSRAGGLAPLLAAKAHECMLVAHIPPLEAGMFPAHVVVASASDLDARLRAAPFAAARTVAGNLLKWMVLTWGGEGATAYSADGITRSVPAPSVQAVDSTGAGDAFAAGLCHALAQGIAMDAALTEAVRWGSAKVARDGSALRGETVRDLCHPEPKAKDLSS